jgi:polyisoprenoid-binding protein YceI
VYWEVLHFGTSTARGRFDDIDGHIAWQPGSGHGVVSISVGTGSVNTGVRPLDAVLRGSDYLHTREHPRAYFVARDLRTSQGQLQALHGELTLRGRSWPLVLRATHFRCAPHPQQGRELCGGDFEAVFNRSDFGITEGLPFVGDRVRLLVQVEALREGSR